MGLLTIFAFNARSEAERQRNEAEGLVEFMLTDLRTTLKGVGRLDAMTTVNKRAMRYYDDQDAGKLPTESRARRARVLLAIGEDDETLGNYRAARTEFEAARRTTTALLAEAPDDPARIFDQAQSEFWIGFSDYDQNRFAAAKQSFIAYKRFADRLMAIAPSNPKYIREVGYADGDLCSIALKPPKDPVAALALCSAALQQMESAAQRSGASSDIALDIANRHGWLADAYRAGGDNERALAERLVQERIMNELIAADPMNLKLKSAWIGVQRILAWMSAESGQQKAALARLQNAAAVSDGMIAFDKKNQMWIQQRAKLSSDIEKIGKMPLERNDK
jgi:hypothetical protein